MRLWEQRWGTIAACVTSLYWQVEKEPKGVSKRAGKQRIKSRLILKTSPWPLTLFFLIPTSSSSASKYVPAQLACKPRPRKPRPHQGPPRNVSAENYEHLCRERMDSEIVEKEYILLIKPGKYSLTVILKLPILKNNVLTALCV